MMFAASKENPGECAACGHVQAFHVWECTVCESPLFTTACACGLHGVPLLPCACGAPACAQLARLVCPEPGTVAS